MSTSGQRKGSVAKVSVAKVKDLVSPSKITIEVTLSDDQKDAFVPQYTSLDEINGQVSITASAKTLFRNIYLTFEGSTKTFVEKVAPTPGVPSRHEKSYTFIRLLHDDIALPNPRFFEAGQVYIFPFNFVVPHTMLPSFCPHKRDTRFPEDGHTALPPSLGDPMVASAGGALASDMSPQMARIVYLIKCRIISGKTAKGHYTVMAEESKKLRIIPAIDEQPPRDIRVEENDRHGYRIRQDEKATQGILGIIGRNMGRLVAQATQPDNIKLPYFRGPDAATPPTTMATMNVRFDPEEESSPLPALATLQGKLRVGTGYSVLFMDEIPTSPANFHNNIYRGIFRETLSMPTRSLSNTEWKKHTSSASPGTGDAEIPNPSKKYKGGSFYTAQIKVPVLLTRDNKVFVPSFDSCLISRIYTLDLYVSLKTPGWALTNPKLHLKLPLHVFSERSPNAQEIISAEEEAATAIREGNPHPDPNRVVPRVPEYSEHALPDAPSTLSEAPIISRRPQRSRAQQARGASLTFEDEEAPPPNYNDLPTAGGSNGQLRGANRQPSIGTLARQPSSIIDFADH